MSIEVETREEEVAAGWKDEDGFVTVFRQGRGPRANPARCSELTMPTDGVVVREVILCSIARRPPKSA